MIGKLKKGSSFGGCIRYVTGKDEAKIIASDGVLLGTNAEITQSFELQRQLNPRIKKPVGHIALSFKPEDKPRLTDEFMAKIAIEYMQMMGITDTQFIIVRHHNTDNPHEGGNLAASKIRNLECPNYEICLIDYGCGKFNRKIHIMEQYP